MKCCKNVRRGFTLVELSIVLVILGLLVGGVLTGQSLIRASELRAITSESTRFVTAINAFRDKYFAIPGDMNNASSFWPSAGNGDGSGSINTSATAGSNEISTFWIHLANAGLIEGNYTNISYNAMTPGTHNPRSKINGVGWNVLGLGSVTAAGVQSTPQAATIAADLYYAGTYGNILLVGGGTTPIAPNGFLKAEEAWNIDTKVDDGRPDQGSVTTLERQGSATAGAGCGNLATSTSALAAVSYDLSNTSATACSLVFKTGS